ncbi:MAG: hypothetical protein ACK4V6_08435 [Microthrixaceae bacterium]
MSRARGAVELAPITTDDLAEVGAFLQAHLNQRVSADTWAATARPPWNVYSPNHGFLLRDEGRVVGVYLAYYSDRLIRGKTERFCNLGSWCVNDSHRPHGLRLLRALLAQPEYHFTDLSPSPTVAAVNARLKFQSIDTATALVPNLRWPIHGRGARIISHPDAIEPMLAPEDLQVFRDHRNAAAVRQFAIVHDGGCCVVVVRKERRRGLPLFASILHVSHPADFRRHASLVYRHLLVRHRALASLVELRVVGHRPAGSRLLAAPRAKMYRSATLHATDIDDLYSELTCVVW